MKICTAHSIADNASRAIDEAYDNLIEQMEASPDVVFTYATETYDPSALNQQLRERAGDIPLHGGTSCQGVITEKGMAGDDGHGLGLLAISDPDGAYGVGAADIGDDPGGAARQAVQTALNQAGRIGEVPQMIWLTAAPGHEEAVIEGIANVLGPDVPVLGGSAADNAVAGNWHQFANGDVYDNAVVVTAVFSSGDIGYSFHSGYEPTDHRGTVTRASGRTLYEIDGEPAAEVYNRWTDGLLDDQLGSENSVLGDTTLNPLGRVAGTIEDTPYFQLSHPETVTEDNALTLFTTVEEGQELICMTGTTDSLISRAGRVADSALQTSFSDADEIAGGLIIYCAGCMLTVQDRIGEVADSINDALDHKPYLGTFTFGEQGCFLGGENRHGNLMITVVTFAR